MRVILVAAVGSVALLVSGTGTAAAEFVPDASRTTTTRDGWVLTVSKTAENLTRVPNMATTLLTREGFVSVDYDADIAGEGSTAIRAASLTGGFQLGCQIDMSNGVTMGGAASLGPWVSGQASQSPGASAGLAANVSPSMSVTVRPGSIATLPVATKAMSKGHAAIQLNEINMKVDGCGGLTAIRTYAVLAISTEDTDTQIMAYGPPVWL